MLLIYMMETFIDYMMFHKLTEPAAYFAEAQTGRKI